MAKRQAGRSGNRNRSSSNDQQFQLIVEQMPSRVIAADRDLKITYMNQASTDMLRRLQHLLPYDVDEMIGKSIDAFHTEKPALGGGGFGLDVHFQKETCLDDISLPDVCPEIPGLDSHAHTAAVELAEVHGELVGACQQIGLERLHIP